MKQKWLLASVSWKKFFCRAKLTTAIKQSTLQFPSSPIALALVSGTTHLNVTYKYNSAKSHLPLVPSLEHYTVIQAFSVTVGMAKSGELVVREKRGFKIYR